MSDEPKPMGETPVAPPSMPATEPAPARAPEASEGPHVAAAVAAPAAMQADGEPEKPKAPSFLSRAYDFIAELVHVVLISLAIIVPVRYFLIQPFYVKGASMEPNFNDHEYLIIDEIGYRFHAPERGQIVVFRYPNDPRQFFIKRIIGLPGERIRVTEGHLLVYNDKYPDGKALDESAYLGNLATNGENDTTLGANEYWLMGDNRGASLDSRAFGAVPKEFIVGRVWLRGWPPEKTKVFSTSPQALK